MIQSAGAASAALRNTSLRFDCEFGDEFVVVVHVEDGEVGESCGGERFVRTVHEPS